VIIVKKTRKVVTISLSPEIAVEYEKLAKEESKNKSQLFRDMFRLYKKKALENEFFKLQRYGTIKARKKRILTEEDVEKIVFEGR